MLPSVGIMSPRGLQLAYYLKKRNPELHQKAGEIKDTQCYLG